MGSFYMEATQINYRRDETLKTVDQKLQELSETSAIDTDIAPVFKSTNTYAPGDMVYYRNKLYTFNVEHTGAWAAGDVTATDVTTEISSLRSGLTNYEATTNAALALPENTGKNVLPYTLSTIKQNNPSGTWVDNVVTINGVAYTITVSGDKVTKISATRVSASESNAILELGDYAAKTGDILSGCPIGGSNTTYKVYCRGGSTGDFGKGATIAAGDVGVSRRYAVAVFSTSSPTNLEFYPMIRPATITDATFAPYIPSVESRIEAVESGLTDAQSGLVDLQTITNGIYSLYKERQQTSGNVVFTLKDLGRWVGILMIVGNDSKYAIYGLYCYPNGQLTPSIDKIVGSGAYNIWIDNTTGELTVEIPNWSRAVLLSTRQFE